MASNQVKATNIFMSSLQKYVTASMLLGFAIVLELLYNQLGIAKISGNIGSWFKIALVPLILIGFLVGLKYSVIFCFLYACFHLSKALFFRNLIGYMESMNFNLFHIIATVFLDYLLVDITYSLSGLFYKPNLEHITHYKKIWTQIILIFSVVLVFKFISSRFIWFETIKNNSKYVTFLPIPLDNPNLWCLAFNIIPVCINLLIVGFLLCFLNPRIKIYLQNK
ncbi:MAG: hypothetical protein AB3F67_3050 [Candidatus Phytoplasma solani]